MPTLEVNTTRPLDVPDVSADMERVAAILTGRLLLGGPDVERPGHPSPLAQSIIQRLVVVALMPGALNTDPDKIPQAAAFVETASMLGGYIRRLEDVARAHATCPKQ